MCRNVQQGGVCEDGYYILLLFELQAQKPVNQYSKLLREDNPSTAKELVASELKLDTVYCNANLLDGTLYSDRSSLSSKLKYVVAHES
jgi:hypothetical protein